MNNAEKFQEVFGYYATEMWAKPETEFLEWINSEYRLREQSIEVSEGDLYIPLNNQTVERINRLHKDECGEYFDEKWLFNELEQISEFREVSEDCSDYYKGYCAMNSKR